MKRDFLAVTDFSKAEIYETFRIAKALKADVKAGKPHHYFANETMAMIFAKPSLRTRVSFETGMVQFGGHALYLGPSDISIGKREAVKDISRVISRYNNWIMARLFLHEHMIELAKYASVPVINGLTDYNHPCQIMADMLTIYEHRGQVEDQKVVFIGDGNNVCNSFLNFASVIPYHFVLAAPEGYDPDPETLAKAKAAGISEIEIVRDPIAAAKDADVLYTDVWTSMGQEVERRKRVNDFKGFQINNELLSYAKSDALVMHCLPAHYEEEITESVIDGPHSVVFDEAENRMHAQKAVMVMLAISNGADITI
ncbi:MAG: ornithine carbamoyltransferase [Candidatus Marinimicrobia bacterium]|nr:ornithine carbamoyltransferase [Candidatus Neomarinimicrobiota bacterium]MCF7851157.1 ornithine carbamoyltransferase [Candidatus Neomarinimicrobiota bacterium]